MAGTVTQTREEVAPGIERIRFACTADASDGSFPSTAVAKKVTGFVMLGVTKPGSTNPTAAWDAALTDEHGCDVFGATLGNRSASAAEQAVPALGSTYGERFVNGSLTLAITNNSVNSAGITIDVYIRKVEFPG